MLPALVALLLPVPAGWQGEDPFETRVLPVLEARCFGCHDGDDAESGFDLAALSGDLAVEAGAWRAVRKRVARGEMPPRNKAPLAPDDRAALVAWIDAVLPPEPAPDDEAAGPLLRRLNRREYAHTIRDLFGVAIEAHELPADEVGHGFDTLGAVLSTSELLLEAHLRLAERVAERAVLLPDPPEPPRRRVDGAKLGAGKASGARGRFRALHSNGEVTLSHELPREGEYAVRVRVHGDQAGPEPCRLALLAEKREVARSEVPERAPEGRVVEAYLRLPAGKARFAVAFLNDYWAPNDPDPAQRDRNLVVEWLEIEGPLDAPSPSRYQREELDPRTRGTLRHVVERLLRRAWRRPVDAEEVARVVALASAEQGFERSVRVAIVAALASPEFLYRPEVPLRDPRGTERLGPHAVAARLSYFLWSSTPDRELSELADHDDLRLRGQVRRMVADARSQALSEGFAVQWLQLGRLEQATPDPTRFPEFDEALRASLRAEATLLFDSVLRERRPARTLLDPGYTFLDERLARHYGLAGVEGPALRRVPLDPGARGGVLGLGAVLTATSYPTRTSPSARGKFVLEALLGAPPPPPPPGVGVLAEASDGAHARPLRERLEAHRNDPACAACHAAIDPIGFGLENFDATGRWRTRDGRHAIDARGALTDGRAFAGPAELKALLAADPAFVRTLFEQLAIYALGRGLTPDDQAWIKPAIAAAGRDPTLIGLIEELVESEAFRAP
ncbi:MAG: DUF1592 domain-containing protein [Planctomycetes bacterium]|nr:DUF1592 domain-containing protein [Planctomycetota bacterium]